MSPFYYVLDLPLDTRDNIIMIKLLDGHEISR